MGERISITCNRICLLSPLPSSVFLACRRILTSHLAPNLAHRSEPEAIFGPLNLSEGVLADLKATIARRLTPKPVKVRADVEVKCFAYAGIEAIRRALQAGEDASTEDVKINVRLVAPPLYVMTTTSTDKTAAIEVMEKAVDIIGETIASEGGDMTVKMKVSSSVSILGFRKCQ